jgi:hypothetical protein
MCALERDRGLEMGTKSGNARVPRRPRSVNREPINLMLELSRKIPGSDNQSSGGADHLQVGRWRGNRRPAGRRFRGEKNTHRSAVGRERLREQEFVHLQVARREERTICRSLKSAKTPQIFSEKSVSCTSRWSVRAGVRKMSTCRWSCNPPGADNRQAVPNPFYS